MSSIRCGINPNNFRSLTERRVEFDVTFIYKVLYNVIDAPDLLSKLSLAVPYFYSRYLQTLKLIFTPLTMVTLPFLTALVALIIICQILIFLRFFAIYNSKIVLVNIYFSFSIVLLFFLSLPCINMYHLL